MPLCKAGCVVHIRKVSCSVVVMYLVQNITSRKHTLRSYRARETDEKAAERRSIDRTCKAKKKVIETEEESLERKSYNRARIAKKKH